MPVAQQPWHIRANVKSAEVRSLRRKQRLAFRGLPARDLVPALIDASPELATYRLQTLFAARETGANGVIPGFGVQRFDRAMAKLRREGNEWAHGQTRLRQLSTLQRRQLLRAVLEFAPADWAGGSA